MQTTKKAKGILNLFIASDKSLFSILIQLNNTSQFDLNPGFITEIC